jgi:hypothetical protein
MANLPLELYGNYRLCHYVEKLDHEYKRPTLYHSLHRTSTTETIYIRTTHILTRYCKGLGLML